MTMDRSEQHPDDERLAALVDTRPLDEADASVRAHVATCAQCASVVDELSALRAALAELPDVVPPRPMRLLPPVEQRRRGWLAIAARRLFAPALVGGLALGVVGGAGSLATLGSMMGASAGAAPQREVAAPAAAPSAADQGQSLDTSSHGAASSERPEPQSFNALRAPGSGAPEPIIWPLLLVAGLALIGVALLLRYVVQPRAA
jgi:anti-sigma factor RsiW